MLIQESDGAADQPAKSDKMKKIWSLVFKHYDLDCILHYNSLSNVARPRLLPMLAGSLPKRKIS